MGLSAGSPRVVPVGFSWTGEEFVVSTATNSPKLASLSERPDVSLSIDTGNTPDEARSLSVRGRAEVAIVDGLVPEYLAAARETMDAEAAADFERTCREMYDGRRGSRSGRGGHASPTSAPGESPSSFKSPNVPL